MKRFHSILPVLILLLGAASPGPPAAGERPAEAVLGAFAFPTTHGELSGTIEQRLDDAGTLQLARIRLTLAPSGQGSVVTIVRSPREDYYIHVSAGGLGELYFRARADAAEVEHLAGPGVDCRGLAASPLIRAQRELLPRLATELEARGTKAADPRLRSATLALALSESLFELDPECREIGDPRAGACYHDTRTYDECVRCCDGGWVEGVVVGACAALGSVECGPWCRWASALACQGLVNLAEQLCIVHNCQGLPGNPACPDPPPPCPGLCMVFCGPGHSSACGSCPADRPECCD